MKITFFWDVTPCSLVDRPHYLKDLLSPYSEKIHHLFNSFFTLNTETACSSETMVPTTQHLKEDCDLHTFNPEDRGNIFPQHISKYLPHT
jgi:hypothetical protein